MPITSPASYLPTLDLFIPHWTSANTALVATGPILVSGGVSVADLTALHGTLQTQRAEVESARNGVEGARADIETLKASLLARLNQFNNKLPTLGARPFFLNMLPKAYTVSEGMGKVLPPLDDMADVWDRYDAENPPLTIMDGYHRADFQANLLALKTAYTAYGSAKTSLTTARGKRNETQDKIKLILVQYRQRIAAEFAEGSAILASLPAYSPPDTGHTPDAVALTGTYNPATQQSDLAWSAVTDEAVVELELRATTGPEYDAEDETILATFLPGAPPTWSGSFGPQVLGAATTFKLYAKTATGREHGSNPITTTRTA
jgi:hypothetical protein